MHKLGRSLSVLLLASLLCSWSYAQQPMSSTSSSNSSATVVPRLVNFSGRAADLQGKAGVAGITFAIYSEQYGGSPLWVETQSVNTDAKGNYTAQLGATKSDGLPLDLFTQGEARWLGVRINGGEEQPRVLLLSVPYALKAADAETVGGLPASAFMLAASPTMAASGSMSPASSLTPSSVPPPATVTGSGTADYLPLWTSSSALVNSVEFQSGSGTSAKIGINTTTPTATLDVNGGATIRGLLNLPTSGNAKTTAGTDSRPLGFVASAFNTSTNAAANQVFHWQAEPVGNDTAAPSATLNLLFGSAPNTPAETGLRINGNGQISFASGQTFPGAGSVSSVGLSAPSSDFTVSGSPVTGSGTLGLNWTVAPTSSDTANAIVKRDSTGSFAATAISANMSAAYGVALDGTSSSTTYSYGVLGAGYYAGVAGSGLYGVIAQASSSGYDGVYATGPIGVFGGSSTQSGYGVDGYAYSGEGVYGSTYSGYGVYGLGGGSTGTGVYGLGPVGTVGISNSGESGVYGESSGWGLQGYGDNDGTGILAGSQYGYAGWFNGDVEVDGNLSKAGGSFKIDDPIDPANKYLYHSFVESPDKMNIYNGNVTTDAQGNAVVTLPDWFESLNRDFRYQLTVMGQFAQAIVSSKVANHQFAIKTDKPNVEVSWQVTGVRQDAWANAHRIPVEQDKPAAERGFYLHPELFGASAQKGVLWARYPNAMKNRKVATNKAIQPSNHQAALMPGQR